MSKRWVGWIALIFGTATMAFAEETSQFVSTARVETYRSDWTVFDAQRPLSPVPTKEELNERKREFSFKVAETAQEVTNSLGLPLLPQLIEGASRMAREVYRLKKEVNKRHIHLDVSKDSAEVKLKFRF